MKLFIVIIITSLLFVTCAPTNYDVLRMHPLKHVDTSGAYVYWGKYFIDEIKDTSVEKDEGILAVNVFDGLNGKLVSNGIAWLQAKDTMRVLFKQGFFNAKLPAGVYNISVDGFDGPHLPLSIKSLQVFTNKKISISVYIGNSVQY